MYIPFSRGKVSAIKMALPGPVIPNTYLAPTICWHNCPQQECPERNPSQRTLQKQYSNNRNAILHFDQSKLEKKK